MWTDPESPTSKGSKGFSPPALSSISTVRTSYETTETSSFMDDESQNRETSFTMSSFMSGKTPPPPPPPPSTSSSRVNFGDVTVRNYEMCMCDNPSVSSGPPVGLAWEWDKETVETRSLDDFEEIREIDRRDISIFARRGRIPVEKRVRMCLEGGATGEEIKSAVKEIREIQERMIQNIYGASPFEEVIEKWNSFTEQINMGAIVAAKKLTKVWKKKARAKREKRESVAAAAEAAPATPNTILVDSEHPVGSTANPPSPESKSPQNNALFDSAGSTPLKAEEGPSATPPQYPSVSDDPASSESYPSYSPNGQLKSALKKVSQFKEPLPPPPPPPRPTGIERMSSVVDIKVDLKDFAKKTVNQFRRASKLKFGKRSDSSSLEDDDASSVGSTSIASDMEKVFEQDNTTRLSWGMFDGDEKSGGNDGQNGKDCVIS